MNKNFKRLLIASMAVSFVNFSPVVVNFDNKNLQIVSVAYAAVENVTAKDSAIFDFGEDDEKIVETVKNVARMRAIQAAKEKAGIYVKSFSKTVNGRLTDDDISAYTSNNIEILSVDYKKIPVQAHDVYGNDTGKIAFMYEAIVTAKVDTSDLQNYIRRDEKEKITIVQQNNDLQKNAEKISNDFENLRNTSENKTSEQIKNEIQKIDDDVLAQQKIDEGLQAWENKNFEKALDLFDIAVNLNPNNYQGYFGRGACFNEWKYYPQAIYDFTQAIKLNPNLDDLYIYLGIAYANIQKFDQAILNFDKAIELNSNYSIAYENRGVVYGILKNYSQALEDLNQAIKLNPNDAMTYYNRGITHKNLKNYEQAIEDYTQAINLNPNYTSAYGNRGIVYTKIKNYNKAMKDLNKSVQLGSKDKEVYFCRGICYKEFGENKKAEENFAKAKELGWK